MLRSTEPKDRQSHDGHGSSRCELRGFAFEGAELVTGCSKIAVEEQTHNALRRQTLESDARSAGTSSSARRG